MRNQEIMCEIDESIEVSEEEDELLEKNKNAEVDKRLTIAEETPE